MQEYKITSDPQELFRRWYEVPLKMLETIENGDGGFVALATALLLYDRLVQTEKGKEVGINEIAKSLAIHLGTSEQVAREFWKIFRHGLLHSSIPKQNENLPRYRLTHEISKPVVEDFSDGERRLLVEPWLFAKIVLDLWRRQPERLNVLRGNPFPLVILPDSKVP